MKTYLKWAHRVRTRLAANVLKFCHFALPSGPLLKTDAKRLRTAVGHRFRNHSKNTKNISDLIQEYESSKFYLNLSVATKKSYDLYLRRIADKFGTLPIGVLDERGTRRAIRQWRDEHLSSQPRSADATIAVFRVLLNFAVDEEYIDKNPAASLGRIHTKTRRDIIWSDAQIGAFLNKAPRHLARTLLVALWTGQRQSDLLTLEWTSYDGEYIRLQQRKSGRGASGRRVKILVSNELRNVLAEIEKEQIARAHHTDLRKRVPRPNVILTTAKGTPWRLGFRATWRKAVADAGISGVTFHDLRGTFITLSHRAGAAIRDIAEASGHDENHCERVIRQHYLASSADRAITQLETSKKFATSEWVMAGSARTKDSESSSRFTGPRRPRAPTNSMHSSD